MQKGKQMRLVVKQNDRAINEFRFTEGSVAIGRQANNQVVLADRTVSKKHAVISRDQNGKWMVEDMKSANKTYLNDKPIEKAEIKTGDCLRISEFTIQIVLGDSIDIDKPTKLEDTLQLQASLTTPRHETVIRKPDAAHAPAMRLPAKRLSDFSQAADTISKAENLDTLLPALLNIILKQFSSFRVWCALRDQPSGPMTSHAGKRRDGRRVELSELQFAEKINEAVEKGQSLVLPSVTAQMEEKDRIRSALIAPIMRPAGCFGVLYVDNAMVHEHYSLSDLDYLMLLAIHTSAILKNLL
jgi:pSer/pThr/pTyr-binding forkhead associated (FHA) protein